MRTVLLSLCRISSSQMDMNLDTIRKHMMSICYVLLLCKYCNEIRIIIKLFVSVSQRCNLYLNFSGFREAIKNKADRNYDSVLSGTIIISATSSHAHRSNKGVSCDDGFLNGKSCHEHVSWTFTRTFS